MSDSKSDPKSDSKSAAKPVASASLSFEEVSLKAPKFHRPVIVKALDGKTEVKAVRKPEGWYPLGSGVGLGYVPKEFRAL